MGEVMRNTGKAAMIGGDKVVVLCTAPPLESSNIAKALVKAGLAACVNVSRVRSHYLWEGELCDDKEDLLVIKTSRERVDLLADRIKELHSYDVPEILVLSVTSGEEAYLRWMDKVLGHSIRS